MPDDVLIDRAGPVGRLTINRPERRNALNGSVLSGLRQGLADLRVDESIRVVVLTGAGDRAFSAGADLVGPDSPAAGSPAAGSPGAGSPAAGSPGAGSLAGGEALSPEALHQGRGELANLFRDLWELGKPSIARVRGYALAGGMGLALACDLVVASDDAVFGTPEIDIGIWPYMVTVALLRSLPPRRALELMMTGRRLGAAEAERFGVVNRVVPAAELDATVDELTEVLAAKPTRVLAAGRASFYRALDMTADDALAYLHPLLTVATQTDDAAEGRAAFADRRPPRWASGGRGSRTGE